MLETEIVKMTERTTTENEIIIRAEEPPCCTCIGEKKCAKCACVRGNKACKNCRNFVKCKNQYNYLNAIKGDLQNKKATGKDNVYSDNELRKGSVGGMSENARNNIEGPSNNNLADEGKSGGPEDVENVIGDGNCFFRSISKALFATENNHERIRKEVVMKMRQDEAFYKEYTGSNFAKHTEQMLNSKGGVEIWATEAEIIGTSERYDLDLFVYSLVGNKPQWLLYTRNGKCNHRKNFVKILHTGSHYKLVHDKGRPCTC